MSEPVMQSINSSNYEYDHNAIHNEEVKGDICRILGYLHPFNEEISLFLAWIEVFVRQHVVREGQGHTFLNSIYVHSSFKVSPSPHKRQLSPK